MAEKRYYITQWEWDAESQEYNPKTIAEGKNLEAMQAVFASMVATIDNPQIELIEVGEDEDIRLDIKEA